MQTPYLEFCKRTGDKMLYIKEIASEVVYRFSLLSLHQGKRNISILSTRNVIWTLGVGGGGGGWRL